jgi:cytochrome c553
MKPNVGVPISILVVALANPLIAVFRSPRSIAAAQSAQAALNGAISHASPQASAPENRNPPLPSWAFAPSGPRGAGVVSRAALPPDDGTVLYVPGSSLGYTRTQIRNLYGPPDWFPNSHPEMPMVVSQGRKPVLTACSYCHLPNGFGRPENQSIAGLPAGYIEEQLEDFKNDRRHSSVPAMAVVLMIPVAKSATHEEIEEAAEYFASVKPRKWIRVVETSKVPKSHPSGWMWVVDEGGGTEPIGQRVIEVSENQERTEMRDESSGFVAYAPIGSLKRGERLVRTGGNGKTTPCTICHGPNLKGLGNIPSIAGRSPSQMARQIFDFQTGARNGVNAPLMKSPVSNLTDADIVAITAYLASLEP